MQAPTPHPGSIQPGATSIRRQHGSMAIAMMLMLLGLISILGIVEVGYLYWAHRDAQKVADLAALSGAQQLPDCTAATTAASNNATTDNSFKGTPTVSCGAWGGAASPDSVTPASSSTAATNTGVKVVAQMPLTPFFGFAKFSGTNATAVAINNQPIASFSVGSSLANISPTSPLNLLLKSALGTQLGLQLLSYNGIANTNISLLDLINQLNINAGTVNGVLSAPITVSDFLGAYVQVLQQSSNAANIDLSLVNSQIAAIEAQIGNTPLKLGDILNVNANTTDPNAALKTNVSALDILSAVLLAADSKNGVALPATSINIPGIASVNLMLSIVEPPQLGIGGIGTTVHTAQIRLYLDVTALSGTALTGGQSLLDIPLYLEVAPTDATLTSIQCGVSPNTATIQVEPGVLNAFLGKGIPPSAFSNTSQTWQSLIDAGSMAPLVNVNLGPITVAQLLASANVQLATNPVTSCTYQVGQQGLCPSAPTGILSTAITSLLSSSNLKTGFNVLGLLNGLNLGPLVSGLTGLLQPVLSPLFGTLDTLLVNQLLAVLGVNIGTANVTLISINCNAGAQLVY